MTAGSTGEGARGDVGVGRGEAAAVARGVSSGLCIRIQSLSPLLNWGLGPYLQAGEGSPETPPDRGGEKQTNLDWKLTRGRS